MYGLLDMLVLTLINDEKILLPNWEGEDRDNNILINMEK